MEIQLQELIEQIKKEGVTAAEKEANDIIASAKSQAEKIISDANTQAEKIITNAKTENERMTKSSEDAIRQAGRNLLISFRESIARELVALVGEKIEAVYSSDALEHIIINIVEKWASNPDTEDITVILDTESLDKLQSSLLAALKQKMMKGITLRSSDNFNGGFRIASNNDNLYYDYSLEAVVDMISGYLSPKVIKLLKEAE